MSVSRVTCIVDNLDFGLDAEVNHKLAVLRHEGGSGALQDAVSPGTGCFFSIDPEAEVIGSYRAGNGCLLDLKYEVRKAPRWMALHISVGGIDLTDASVIGLICKSTAEQAVTIRPALRSARPGGFFDAFLPKHVVAFSAPSTHIDILKLQGRADVPATAEWRELVLFFEPKSSAVTLRDLRVFIV